MPRDVRVYLHDVLTSCKAVTGFVEGKTLEDYAADLLLRSAVERQLSIVGEAVNQAVKLQPTLRKRITSARQTIDFRNLLIHAYTTVSAPVVWTVLEVHLPVLIAEVETPLAEFAND